MYTAFCSAYEDGESSSSVAGLVSQACAAATPCMPSCAAIADVKKQLEQQQGESSQLRIEFCNVQSLLEIARDRAENLQTQLRAAEAELKKVETDKASETKLLNELWRVFKAWGSALGYRSLSATTYASTTMLADLQKRLPDFE
jgi:uncharacterized protein (DUF3084 family)